MFNLENMLCGDFAYYKKLDRSKLKAYADENLKVSQMTKFLFDRIENIIDKGKIADW